jgi:hypothetical protein
MLGGVHYYTESLYLKVTIINTGDFATFTISVHWFSSYGESCQNITMILGLCPLQEVLKHGCIYIHMYFELAKFSTR